MEAPGHQTRSVRELLTYESRATPVKLLKRLNSKHYYYYPKLHTFEHTTSTFCCLTFPVVLQREKKSTSGS